MRKIFEPQMKFGEVHIKDIQFDLRSRDEIPKLLMGIQSLYCNPSARAELFTILEKITPKNVNKNNGRPGMDIWKIFVLGTLRLCCNWDYDKVTEIANNHHTLRLMLFHSPDDRSLYALQTIRDNLALFQPETLDEINQVVIKYGHELVGKKKDENLKGSCDSFVVETDVHYPTDINLLFDAMRKIITLTMALSNQFDLSGWRKGQHNLKKVKKLFRKAQQAKRSKSKNQEKAIEDAHQAYLDFSESIIEKAKHSIEELYVPSDVLLYARIIEIQKYITHAERQIDQIDRRIFKKEKIPHSEKVFSIFEEHTEWISKGKAGVPQELGLRVCILKDQFGFILHHRVMQNETDEKIAVPMIAETKERFPDLNSCTFDKAFHTPWNQEKLLEIIEQVILPRKGRLSKANKEIEDSDWFKDGRRKHPAVESSIAALENHGLDRCRDHGIDGFKRYVGLSIVARNIQILGNICQQKDRELQEKTGKKRSRLRMAA